MDEIIFTKHARLQMEERHVAEKTVLACLKNPDKIILQNFPRFRAVRKLKKLKKDYLIVVVFDLFTQSKEIVTVFYTSKFSKYL